MQTTTTLKYKDFREGTSARGAWKLTIFEGGDNREYTTLDGALASAVNALAGQLVTVEYTEKPPKPGKEQYGPSYSLDSVSAAPEGATAAPAADNPRGPLAPAKGEFRSPAQIIRSSALELAVGAFGVVPLDPVADTVGVLELAKVYETYITEGIEEEPEA